LVIIWQGPKNNGDVCGFPWQADARSHHFHDIEKQRQVLIGFDDGVMGLDRKGRLRGHEMSGQDFQSVVCKGGVGIEEHQHIP
jgi:hypothetical protein